MALYITISMDGKQTNEYEWHVGKDNPMPICDRNFVTGVQADGDELEYIKRTFANIPMTFTKRVVRWYGDDAKFIAANL